MGLMLLLVGSCMAQDKDICTTACEDVTWACDQMCKTICTGCNKCCKDACTGLGQTCLTNLRRVAGSYCATKTSAFKAQQALPSKAAAPKAVGAGVKADAECKPYSNFCWAVNKAKNICDMARGGVVESCTAACGKDCTCVDKTISCTGLGDMAKSACEEYCRGVSPLDPCYKW